jgi:membrane associated rhomboid family serine protease
VNRWLLETSWWQRALVMGAGPGIAVMLVLRLRDGAGWPAAALGGLVAGLVVGPVLGAMLGQQFRRQLDAVGEGPADMRARVAGRATLTGPIPTDPDERAATVRLIDHQLAEMRARRTFFLAVQVVVIAVLCYLAVASSPWWWAAVAGSIGLLLLVLATPRWLERRRSALLPD